MASASCRSLRERWLSMSSRFPGKSFGLTILERALIVLVGLVVLAALVLIFCLVKERRTNGEDVNPSKLNNLSNVCMTPSCITEASRLINSLDLSVDPCTDFYSFVCGNWIKNAYMNTNSETQYTKLDRNVETRVRGILEDSVQQEHLPENKQKAIDYYKSCMDENHRDKIGAGELLLDLKKFGGWPLIEEHWNGTGFDWLDLMVQLHRSGYESDFLFAVSVNAELKNDYSGSNTSLIYVTEPSLGLNKVYYYVEPEREELLASYKGVIFRMAQLLKPDIDKNRSMADIEEAFEIEFKLANISMSKVIYFDTLQYVLNSSAVMIPLEKLLKNLLPPDTKLERAEQRIQYNPVLFEALDMLLKELDNENGKRALANYMFYRVVFRAAKYMSREFYALYMYMQLLQKDQAVLTMPWQICTSYVMDAFYFSIFSSYVAKFMDSKTRGIVRLILEDMRSTAIDEIGNATWLDAESKAAAVLKVRQMKAVIGYYDEIMDDDILDAYYKQVNLTESFYDNVKQMVALRSREKMIGLNEGREKYKWTVTNLLLKAGAFYIPKRNMILIPAGILQEAVFSTGRPNYINYGNLVSIIGHEIAHAFYNSVIFDDPSEKTSKKLKEKKECYIHQYRSYYLPKINATLNGHLTLGENIADNGGLQSAYNAYKVLLQRIGNEKSLPGLPYDEKQLFWISFASFFCGKRTDDSLKLYIKEDQHATGEYRVIGTLSNMKGFSEDFHCKSNSTMNPTSKCSLWE